ncbi:MAG: transposase [Deltaproteobacteria bacterium]|nr:transposase [Deltaproteobacteria bacterium]
MTCVKNNYELSRCGWDSLKVFFRSMISEEDTIPGAVIAIQTFGDFLNSNPHCHVLCTDGVFYESGSFRVAPALDTKTLEKIFQHKVLGMFIRLWRAFAKRQDNGGSGKADHDVAAFGVQRLLRPKDSTRG